MKASDPRTVWFGGFGQPHLGLVFNVVDGKGTIVVAQRQSAAIGSPRQRCDGGLGSGVCHRPKTGDKQFLKGTLGDQAVHGEFVVFGSDGDDVLHGRVRGRPNDGRGLVGVFFLDGGGHGAARGLLYWLFRSVLFFPCKASSGDCDGVQSFSDPPAVVLWGCFGQLIHNDDGTKFERGSIAD